jgi:hypothetical protein
MDFQTQKNYKFILISLVLFIAIISLEMINKRFWLSDFKVYYTAALSYLEGGKVYGVAFGLDTGFYKYSPFILLTFIPATFFSFETASIIHFIVIAFCSVASILLIQEIISRTFFKGIKKNTNILFFIALVCFLSHLVRELHLGNVNMIIVFLLSLGIFYTITARPVAAGIFIALAVLIKPYLLVLALPLLLHKKIKTILSLGAALLFSCFLCFVFFGFSTSVQLSSEWLVAMMDHGSYLYSNHTVSSLIRHYIYSGLHGSWHLYLLILTCLIYVIVFYVSIKKNLQKNNSPESETTYLTLSYFILLALLPNILITDTEHFLFSLPVILFLLNYLARHKNILPIAVFSVLIIFYDGNSSDLLGTDLSDKFENLGLLGIANLGLVGFTIYAAVKIKSGNNLVPDSL